MLLLWGLEWMNHGGYAITGSHCPLCLLWDDMVSTEALIQAIRTYASINLEIVPAVMRKQVKRPFPWSRWESGGTGGTDMGVGVKWRNTLSKRKSKKVTNGFQCSRIFKSCTDSHSYMNSRAITPRIRTCWGNVVVTWLLWHWLGCVFPVRRQGRHILLTQPEITKSYN